MTPQPPRAATESNETMKAYRRTNSCGVEWFVEHDDDDHPTGRVSYCRDAEGQHMWIDAAPSPDRQHAESYSPLTIT